MFVRKKYNPSGIVSIQLIDKSRGKYRVFKTIGSSSDASAIEELYQQGKKRVSAHCRGGDIFVEARRRDEEKQVTEYLLSNMENILLNGAQLILNPVFELIGFDKVEDELLKQLAVSRICQPRSKVATVEYLKSYFDEDVDLNKVYRYLDKLHDREKDKIQEISVSHTRQILGDKIGLCFMM
jgi:hypothetical protein